MATSAITVNDRANTEARAIQASSLAAYDRDELILEHLPQVRLIARRIHERIRGSVALDDLISAGVLGLIAAVDRYDPQQDVKIRTYAEYKIRGAILDSLRELDWAPRQQRRRARLIEQAIKTLEQEYQRLPEEDEIAASLGLSVADYHEWLSDSRALKVGSLDGGSDEEDRGNLLQYVAESEEHWPLQILERAQLEACLARAIERMPKIERTVLSLYFFEEMTLREIAKIMDFHESRISQLKTQAIRRLRAFFKKNWAAPNEARLRS